MLRPGRGHAQQLPSGYTGGGGSARNLDLGYGGSYGGSSTHEFKDKPRHRRGFSANLSLIPAWIIASVAAFCLCVLSFHLNAKHNFLLKQLNVKTSAEAIKVFADLKDGKFTAEQEARKYKTLERHASTKQEAAEKLNRELLKERDELRIKHEGPEKVEADNRLLSRVESYQTMVKQLQKSVQRESKRAVLEKFGPGPHKVEISFVLPSTSAELSFIVEMAPLDAMPHAVHVFLEQVDHGLWNNAWIYVNGPHVLQCGPQADEDALEANENVDERALALKPFEDLHLDSLAFPEYSQAYPHVAWTLGFTGRPGGPDWYINKQDNTVSHGPSGHDQYDLDSFGDPCFARVVEGMDALQKVFEEKTIKEGEFAYFLEEAVHVYKAKVMGDRPSNANQQSQDKKTVESTNDEKPASKTNDETVKGDAQKEKAVEEKASSKMDVEAQTDVSSEEKEKSKEYKKALKSEEIDIDLDRHGAEVGPTENYADSPAGDGYSKIKDALTPETESKAEKKDSHKGDESKPADSPSEVRGGGSESRRSGKRKRPLMMANFAHQVAP